MPQPYLAGPASLSRMLLAKYPSGDRRPDQTSSGMVEPGTKAAAPGRGARGFRRQRHGPAHTGAVVDAIARGEDPPFEADDERAVYSVARQLGRSGRLDQETYDAAHGFLGDAGMVELVSLCGYYTMISFLLNTFAVPLPPGAAPMWDPS